MLPSADIESRLTAEPQLTAIAILRLAPITFPAEAIRTAGHACAPIDSVSSPAPSPTIGTRDASLTEAQTMALSEHKTPEAARLYVKRTNVQRDGVTSPAPVGGDGTERGQTSE